MSDVKEIDLLELAVRVLSFIKRKFNILIVMFICGGLAGGIYNIIEKDTFLYKITISSPEIPGDIIKEELEQLNQIVNNVQRDSFIEKLSDSSKVLKHIKSIEVKVVDDKPNKLVVNITAFDPIYKDDFQGFIQDYLLRNSLIRENLDYKKKEYESTISYILNQIENRNKSALNNSTDIEYVFIDETPTDLFLLKNQYEKKLLFLGPGLIENYPIVPQKGGSGLVISILTGGIAFCLLFVGFYLIKWVNKILDNSSKEQFRSMYLSKSA